LFDGTGGFAISIFERRPEGVDWVTQRLQIGGIELSDDHWKVIDLVRIRYAQINGTPKARDIAEELWSMFQDKGGRKYLYELFPEGPVSTAAELAELPKPLGAEDPSFGVAF
jgi:tRNA 2-thiouridine synthesizing protein E